MDKRTAKILLDIQRHASRKLCIRAAEGDKEAQRELDKYFTEKIKRANLPGEKDPWIRKQMERMKQ